MVTLKIKRKHRIVLYVQKKTIEEINDEYAYFRKYIAKPDVEYFVQISG